jgi:hypothetical protein
MEPSVRWYLLEAERAEAQARGAAAGLSEQFAHLAERWRELARVAGWDGKEAPSRER